MSVDLQGDAHEIPAISFEICAIPSARSYSATLHEHDTAFHRFDWLMITNVRHVYTHDDFQFFLSPAPIPF